jgi:predicted phage baseplate assembly protein
MANIAPKIDSRNAAEVARQVKNLLKTYAPNWSKQNNDPFGEALIAVYARFVELIIDRLNQVPDKNFLAFLDLLGETLLPPQPARVPLTFYLAEGAITEAVVPKGTQVGATPAPGEQQPIIFETESELTVTPALLSVVAVRNPKEDRFSRVLFNPKTPGGLLGDAFNAFEGNQPCEHILYLGHRTVFASSVGLDLNLDFNLTTGGGENSATWEWHNGEQWLSLETREDTTKGLAVSGSVKLSLPTPLPETIVNSKASRWLRCRLLKTITPAATEAAKIKGIVLSGSFELLPDAAFRNSEILDLNQDFFPFGERPSFGGIFYFANHKIFSRPNLQAIITVTVTDPSVYLDQDTLANSAIGTRAKPTLAWEYWDGRSWRALSVNDSTDAFSKTGLNTIAFTIPQDIKNTVVNGKDNYWIRARIVSGNYGQDSAFASFKLDKVSGKITGTSNAITGSITNENSKLSGSINGNITNGILTATITGAISGTINGLVTNDKITASVNAVQLGAAPGLVIAGSLEEGKITSNNVSGTITANQILYRQASTLVPPCLKAITLSYLEDGGKISPDTLLFYNDFAYQEATDLTNAPPHFTHTPNEPSALYLGFALRENAGSFPTLPLTVYFSLKKEETYSTRTDLPSASSPPLLAWEYWDGTAWAVATIQDDTEVFSHSGVIRWLPPSEIKPNTDFGVSNHYWLRTRLVSGEFFPAPQMERALLNTSYATQTVTLTNQVLGSSNVNKDQRFIAAHAPILPGQLLEIEEPEKPSLAELSLLKQRVGDDAIRNNDGATTRKAYWLPWHEVLDFHGSGPRDRSYVLDRLTGEIRFGDGLNGLIPPLGIGNIRLTYYRSGGGSAGNKPVGAVSQLQAALPFIDKVTNHEPAIGGSDAESLDELRKRGPKSLRHRYRAVTKEDFEDLAMMASTEVARALCIPLLDVAGNPLEVVDTEAEEKNGAGRVGVIVVPHSRDRKPTPDRELLRQVQDYLAQHAIATARLSVAGPLYLSLNVNIEVAMATLSAVGSIEARLQKKLESFLHPLTGGQEGSGWPFGEEPQVSDIYRLISEIREIDHVSALTVTLGDIEAAVPGQTDAVAKTIATHRYLIYSGQHRINLTGNR